MVKLDPFFDLSIFKCKCGGVTEGFNKWGRHWGMRRKPDASFTAVLEYLR